MLLTYLMFFVALCLSAVAAFYSIVGLTAIFAAAVIPIVLMGSILEVAKLTVTVWLHEYWTQARWLMKAYLCVAVVMLMIITSMGIFGFLSKAHSDQGMVSGEVLAKISIYDEKIKTSKENIDANRKALKQMDEAVDQVMGRSTTETGADKAVQIRRSQQKERTRLFADIEAEQKKITALNEQRAPVAAEVRKVEAEVGPIKYIAALIYGDNPDANLLERAVRWVIIMLVIVFDPLAIMMLLAATESRKWLREDKSAYEQDDGQLTNKQLEQINESAKEDFPPGKLVTKDELFPMDPHPPGWMFGEVPRAYPMSDQEVEEVIQEFDRSRHAYLDKPFVHFENLTPMPAPTETSNESLNDNSKLARALWKKDNPDKTLKEQRNLLDRGVIDHLPWAINAHKSSTLIGKALPGLSPNYTRGDLFVLTSVQPTQLYKFTGDEWIMIDKSTTDQYTHDSAYIDFLIEAMSKGQYDPELLTELERVEIENKLNNLT